MNAVQLDIQQLRIKHILFKSKLRSVLYGGNIDEAFFSDQGPVGQWFAQVGFTKYRTLDQVQQLYKLHLELSAAARQLVSLYQRSKIEEAHDGLRTIDLMSERFLDLLANVEKLPEATF